MFLNGNFKKIGLVDASADKLKQKRHLKMILH